jgi:hypothetical protein
MATPWRAARPMLRATVIFDREANRRNDKLLKENPYSLSVLSNGYQKQESSIAYHS